jgi:hypothetical protein
MGSIRCQTHGPRAIAHVCPHVRDAMMTGAAPPAVASYPMKDLEGTFAAYSLEFCYQCIGERGLPTPARSLAEEDLEAWGEKLATWPVCNQCLREQRGG